MRLLALSRCFGERNVRSHEWNDVFRHPGARVAQIPACIGRKRHFKFWDANTATVIAVTIHLGHENCEFLTYFRWLKADNPILPLRAKVNPVGGKR